MKPIRCLAIDDEPLALDKLRSYIGKVPFLQLAGACESTFDAMPYLAAGDCDAVFTDISMPDFNGMDFIASLPHKPLVVFTTAYAEHAVRSYELGAVDYLLKPFDFATFQRAANRLLVALSHIERPMADSTIYVKVGTRFVNISIPDIVYVKGMNEYVQFFMNDGSNHIALMAMRQLPERLPENFIQVHRSYIVNMRRIKEVERMRIVLHDGTRIPVSDNCKGAFMAYMSAHTLSRD